MLWLGSRCFVGIVVGLAYRRLFAAALLSGFGCALRPAHTLNVTPGL